MESVITLDGLDMAVLESNLGDRAVSRSMDDIGMTSLNRNPLMTGKSPLGIGRATPKTKRQKRAVPIPASEVANPVKTGYLEVKKSGSWKRCWSILTEDRMYIYRKPTDSHTLDMLMLDDYDVQIVVASSGSSWKTGTKFAFELYNAKVTGTTLLCESREERTEWMQAIGERCQKLNGTEMDGTAEQRGSREKLAPLITRLDGSEKPIPLGGETKDSASSSDLSDEDSPIMDKKKQIIEDKYERVKEAQEMEMLRLNTILNQRRMSADVKINAVEKKLLQQRKQRKRKKNSRGDSLDEEGEFLEKQLEQMKTRLEEVNKESQDINLKQEERLKSIENKKDVEFKILEQERKLQKHRKAAQQALQQIVKGISSITPPIGGSKPRFDLISEEAEDESEERKLSVASSVGISSSDSMGSLCDPKKLLDNEVVVPVMSSKTASAPLTRRHAVHHPPKLHSAESSTDSSSSIDSPDVVRHNFNLVDEFTKSFPAFDGTLEQGSRDKSKSFDSGIADEVDINSNKSSTVTMKTNINGNVNDNEMSSPNVPSQNHIRTEISEDVLRDIEEFEFLARRALEEASWMV
ncbi:uncharacterized protein LOC129276512 isoform X1 [Lytechinus pictus]|uniref:uncharacterized protein LOC129276512 isoform X1 n=1 Tax=Lytechinus pictus TaxID=7653 RepID=UPI0030BA05FD